MSTISPQKRITVKDIAARAGVGQPSVSVVLNGAKSGMHISETTRQKILAAAEDLGYRRNASAANMKSGRSGWVSLVLAQNVGVSGIHDTFITGISQELARHGFHLHVENLPEEKMHAPEMWPQVLREWISDGLIINYAKLDLPELQAMLTQYRIPAIWTNARREADCVYPDEEVTFYSATRQLIDMGHRRILYISPVVERDEERVHYSFTDRRIGYERAMRDQVLQPHLLRSTEFTSDIQTYDAIHQILELPATHRPTAVIAYGEGSIFDFWGMALSHGLRVPEDISLVSPGAGNRKINGRKLSVLRDPFHEVGERAVQQLLRKISEPELKLAPLPIAYHQIEGDTHVAVNS